MSFLKINDPLKRDAIEKEYLELKKNIRDNLLSERVGELQLQTDLSKFYKPITETQKATAREITEGLKPITETQKVTAREIIEGLKPIREGIEKLPEAMKTIKEEQTKEQTKEQTEEQKEEQKEEQTLSKSLGKTAYNYLYRKEPYNRDITFGIHKGQDGFYYLGARKDPNSDYYLLNSKKKLTIAYNNIFVEDEKFRGTDGLWELIMENEPMNYNQEDLNEYKRLLLKTDVLHQEFNPKSNYPRSSKSEKWENILAPIWFSRGYQGKGVVVIPSDHNALLERLDLLLASQEAGHTGVRNELVSICDELKRQGVLDMKA